MSAFIDSGASLVLSKACFSPSIGQQKQVYNCKANDVGDVSVCLRMHKHFLINRSHCKAAKLCLANSWNNSVTATKYIE